jgi:hypothetical protein
MSETVITEIGSCQSILKSIKTVTDGSVYLTLEINPDNQEIISRLMRLYLLNERLFEVGFVGIK